jgi:hypothetical protein
VFICRADVLQQGIQCRFIIFFGKKVGQRLRHHTADIRQGSKQGSRCAADQRQ